MRHTLRTPLNHIIGYSEMLLEEAGERGLEAFTADLQKIHKAGKQLLGFINEFFDASTADRNAAHVPKTADETASSERQHLAFILCRQRTERQRVGSLSSTTMKATATCFPAACNMKATKSP